MADVEQHRQGGNSPEAGSPIATPPKKRSARRVGARRGGKQSPFLALPCDSPTPKRKARVVRKKKVQPKKDEGVQEEDSDSNSIARKPETCKKNSKKNC